MTIDGGDVYKRQDLGRQHQAVVVAVDHDDRTDHPGGNAPRGLEGCLQLVVPAGEGDVKQLGKVVPKEVAGAAPVSYTHLDVYKRQHTYRPEEHPQEKCCRQNDENIPA